MCYVHLESAMILHYNRLSELWLGRCYLHQTVYCDGMLIFIPMNNMSLGNNHDNIQSKAHMIVASCSCNT